MKLKPEDLHTFEAYKKAIRAAAAQIKDNTPFCVYSEVQMPDAHQKLHVLKPFLVLGSPLNVITPLLKDLHGSKKPVCGGVCSLKDGKISLTAQKGKVEYAVFKSHATVFKELLGKDILIPAASGAPGAQPPKK
jgi:hypothetical protein